MISNNRWIATLVLTVAAAFAAGCAVTPDTADEESVGEDQGALISTIGTIGDPVSTVTDSTTLTIEEIPDCGNGTCDVGEDRYKCSLDCGPPPVECQTCVNIHCGYDTHCGARVLCGMCGFGTHCQYGQECVLDDGPIK